jgi:hypothetical protein
MHVAADPFHDGALPRELHRPSEVGFAALTMNKDLGFSSAVFGFGAGVFFLGYCVFEVPANIILKVNAIQPIALLGEKSAARAASILRWPQRTIGLEDACDDAAQEKPANQREFGHRRSVLRLRCVAGNSVLCGPSPGDPVIGVICQADGRPFQRPGYPTWAT